ANNHLIGEAAGVFVAACTWPYLPNMDAWKAQALEILTRELDRQTTKDGFNAELTTAYHEFVMEFALAGLLSARASGQEVPMSFQESVSRMSSCAKLMRDVAGNVPMFGDADDGHVFRLSYEDSFDSLRSTLHACSAVLDQTDIDVQDIDAQTLWLLNDGQIDQLRSSRANDVPMSDVALSDTGYFLLGHKLNTPEEIRLWADVGELGFLSIAAHGHADALSIYLAAGGEEILIDPGTYAYHTDKSWRDYFKGTSAHNTVCVDRVDQSVSGGNFMWTDHATVEVDNLVLGELKSTISAHHDGYARLDDPVIHSRTVNFDKENGLIEVLDLVNCSGTHTIDIHWHFAENLTVVPAADERSWTALGVSVCAGFSVESDRGAMELAIAYGEDDPPSGWVSRKFASKQASSTVRCTQKITGQTRFATKISVRITSQASPDGLR
ncbi:MAG: alginate lyase family protein, partial [Woeseia sp.]|nr:alginate lyase family protein [Woeseia sp.]